MVKTTVSGSFLAKHFPTLFKHFSENASQEEFNKAEQEAAVVFQKHNSNGVTGEPGKLGADVSALLSTSAKLVEASLSAEDLTAFAADMAELQKRITSQADSNKTLSADLTSTKEQLTAAESARDQAQGELATANTTITDLAPKAAAWDAHKAALGNANVIDDANGKAKTKAAASGLTDKEQARADENQRLAAQYPGLMAGIEVGTPAGDQ